MLGLVSSHPLSAYEGTWLCSSQQLLTHLEPPPCPWYANFQKTGRPPLPCLPGVGNHSKSLACNSLGYDLHRPTHTQSGIRFGQHAHPQQVSVRKTQRGGRMYLSVPPWSVPYGTASLLPTHPEGPSGAAPHALHMFLQFKEGADLPKVGNVNTLQYCVCAFQKDLMADSFIKHILGFLEKQTRTAFINGSLYTSPFLNWSVLFPWVPSWINFFFITLVLETRGM